MRSLRRQLHWKRRNDVREVCIDQDKKGLKPLRLSFVGIRKSYFSVIPERTCYRKLPKEIGLSPDTVARLVRCIDGTRDAGKLWEDTYTRALEHAGFVTGATNPCVFYHKVRDITVFVHGDDFTALGTDNDLDWYEIRF